MEASASIRKPEAINADSLSCLQAFDRYNEVPDAADKSLAKQLRARLDSWIKYSGATARPRYNLEHRVKDAPDIANTMTALLKVIIRNVNTGQCTGAHT